MGRSLRLVSLVVCLVPAAVGCGKAGSPASHGGADAASASSRFPLTVAASNGDVTVPARPERIVSLSPTATEMLFAIGAGDQIVAVDDQSNYPPEAPTTKLSGYEPNAEAIASYDPDLVVYASDLGDVATALDRLAIPAILEPAADDLADVYGQMLQLGTVTDHRAGARKVVGRMREAIPQIVDTALLPGHPTYYHELDDTYYSVTSSTFIGKIYAMLGLENIADAADNDGSGYPQLSPEYIIDADPDLIFLADTKCCGQSTDTVAKRAGWDAISAVRHGDVVELDDDIASRWGPRIVAFMRTVADAIRRVGAEAA
jgi:iron complex transport system substrate-binding protein